ncbi:MAG: putative porin, partial [Dysgonamonadaceae bacterium]|jgi:hypothetical protein|nr:putative porin [Dysgonamonadaceae bacterium]
LVESVKNVKFLLTVSFLFFFSFITCSQDISESDSIPVLPALTDSIPTFASTSGKDIGIRNFDAVTVPVTSIDTTKKINYWQITERTGEIISARPDTFLTDYFNRTNAEGLGVAVAYLGNLGLPMESRVFFERADRSQFMFNDVFAGYMKSPGKFNFVNTKIPHSNVAYQRAGSRQLMEERLQAFLTANIGKKLNLGIEVDYLYARGYYQSQSAKHLEWVFFGNYLSDRHQIHLFINPKDYTNAENGGVVNDNDITHPTNQSSSTTTRDIQTRLGVGSQNSTWNRLRGNRFYLNYHYNLGFERKTTAVDEYGDTIKQFIPVSSIIYTFDYRNSKKNFYTGDSSSVARYYAGHTDFFADRKGGVRDSTSGEVLSNTLALSLREGFSNWAKFDLTAFLTQDVRSFTMMTADPLMNEEKALYATYLGGELARRSGKILRYYAQGSFGVLGENLGDLNLSGTIETRIPVWGDTASVRADAYIKNSEPAWYEKHYRSRYFWWDNNFGKVRKYYAGGAIDIPHTNTRFRLGVENVSNYIYFDKSGMPAQYNGNVQVMAARLDQNFHWKALHWDNQIVYQKSGNPEIIPLPDIAAYSSLYIQFPITVLTIQLGANVHYWTKYYAPSYEPALQQFKQQDEIKVGNYPLVGAFVNCHLKQTRFFVEYYNAGSRFISPPDYFSLPHYPVNPTVLKLGLSVDFIN